MKSYNKRLAFMAVAMPVVMMGFGCAAKHAAVESQENPSISATREGASGQNRAAVPPLMATEVPEGMEALDTPFGTMYLKSQREEDTSSQAASSGAGEISESSAAEVSEKPIAGASGKDAAPENTMSKTEVQEKSGEGIVVNFNDADLLEVIRFMAQQLNINYILDAGVRGKVTIQTYGELDSVDLWSVFLQILEVNGLTAVEEGAVYRIVSIKDAPRLSILSRYGTDEEAIGPTERVVLQIIPLAHTDSSEMTKIISPFISAQGTIVSHGESNTLLVVDKQVNILKVLRLVEVFDTDLLDQTQHRYFFLKHAEVGEMVSVLEKIINSWGKNAVGDYQLISVERLNAILVLSENMHLFDKIEEYLTELDAADDVSQRQIYIYSVKNGTAEDLASLLNSIFSGDGGGNERQTGNTQETDEAADSAVPMNPFMMQPTATAGTEDASKSSGSETAFGNATLKDDIRITPDSIRNVLIIEATPSDYRIIDGILSRLDVLPRQVLIEVTIAEVTLDDGTSLGVDWSYVRGEGGSIGSGNLLNGTASSSGLAFTVGDTERWLSTLSALATQEKLNVLAAPSVMASDNKEAVINISNEIPVVSSVYNVTGDANVVSTNVEYRNTGLILTVTPHINENGLVSMSISQEFSEPSEGVEIGGTSYPSFFKRTVNTELVVQHDQTIVIGGLIREKSSKGKSGVPVLNRIPGVGFLFGSSTDSVERNELVLLITPHVVVNLEDVDEVTRNFKAKLGQALTLMKNN